jgi:hypothetical protein
VAADNGFRDWYTEYEVAALGWYRQFREIVLMFAIINSESLCEPL